MIECIATGCGLIWLDDSPDVMRWGDLHLMEDTFIFFATPTPMIAPLVPERPTIVLQSGADVFNRQQVFVFKSQYVRLYQFAEKLKYCRPQIGTAQSGDKRQGLIITSIGDVNPVVARQTPLLTENDVHMMAALMEEAATNLSAMMQTPQAEELSVRHFLPDELAGSASMLREAYGQIKS